MQAVFDKIKHVALAGAVSLGGAGALVGCDAGGNRYDPPVPVTAQQMEDCNTFAQKRADEASANIARDKPGVLRQFGDTVSGNKQLNTPVITAEQIKNQRYLECVNEARLGNARNAALSRQERDEKQAADAAAAAAAAAQPSHAPAPAPVDSAPPTPSTSDARTSPAPVETIQPVPVAIGKLPPYADSAKVSPAILDTNSFGDANLKVLAKTIAMSCGHGGCAAAPTGETDKVLQGQFVAQTAIKFGLNPLDVTDPAQAVVAAGKLQVYNNKALTDLTGQAPQESQLALAAKLGKDAVAALIRNPEKTAAETLTTAYKGNAVAATDAINAIVADSSPALTSQGLLELARKDYEATNAKTGVAIISDATMKKGNPPIDGTAFRNTTGTSMDQTTLGGAAQQPTSDVPLGGVWDRVWNGRKDQSAAAAAR